MRPRMYWRAGLSANARAKSARLQNRGRDRHLPPRFLRVVEVRLKKVLGEFDVVVVFDTRREHIPETRQV